MKKIFIFIVLVTFGVTVNAEDVAVSAVTQEQKQDFTLSMYQLLMQEYYPNVLAVIETVPNGLALIAGWNNERAKAKLPPVSPREAFNYIHGKKPHLADREMRILADGLSIVSNRVPEGLGSMQ
ncbi:hypothetical protein [Crenobacter intestini]|uniref:Uncharacterized protein n=1 Tax=Crenobacter intestini TaxID=2563443 RepID=A0A4T0UJ27_9NEIS|nr:hypothetical protein [Crenobacter intestini]TIC78538.1 hypothetical protein E5K04_15590 [Crenobacter intestini]